MVLFRKINPEKADDPPFSSKPADAVLDRNSMPKALDSPRLSFQVLESGREKKEKQRPETKENKSRNKELKQTREKLYDSMILYMIEIFKRVRNQEKFDPEQAFILVKKIIENNYPSDPVLIKAIHHDSLENYYIYHCVNTAIYTIKIADNLKWPVNKQIESGVGALFHDLGMAMIPEKIIYKKEALSLEEQQLIKNRPYTSSKLLQPFAGKYPWLPQCALQSHERIDGSGYPQGLKEDEICDYAQVTGLAAMYEALIHSRPQGERYLYSSAVKEIIRTNKKSFKREYLKALLNVFSIFPLHSYVRLNTDFIGEVIETYPQQPMRPRIKIIYNMKKGLPVSGEQIVNLPDNSLLNILDSVSAKEVKRLY